MGAVDAAVTETPSTAVFQRRAVQAGLRVVVVTILTVHVQVVCEKRAAPDGHRIIIK